MKVEAWSKLVPSLGGGAGAVSRCGQPVARDTRAGSGGDGEQASRLLSRVSGERRYAGQRGTEEGIRANTGENLTLLFFPSPGDSGRRKMVRGCY